MMKQATNSNQETEMKNETPSSKKAREFCASVQPATGRPTMEATYRNISEEWGDACGCLTLGDYVDQAINFGMDPDKLACYADGIYYDGEKIAERE